MGLFSIFRKKDAGSPRGPDGARAYAVGDIHGRLDLLNQLLSRIADDAGRRRPLRTYVVFLGDLIDRGPDSRGVIERLIAYGPKRVQPVFLTGNHEEALLRTLGGDGRVLRDWLKFGGAECAQSYGIAPAKLDSASDEAAITMLRRSIPRSHVEFLESFADSLRFGDYLFVHAGVRPNIPLEEQKTEDLRWIREPFLSHEGRHEHIVVHGHTVVKDVQEFDNRIAIDTGAYLTGKLTAIGIEDDRRWFIETREGDTLTGQAVVKNIEGIEHYRFADDL